ncbi:MAG: NYN domain-containing protein [Firmicutes bacterium]|nr:NYN domain-containing protein [Bacillota bacterium]
MPTKTAKIKVVTKKETKSVDKSVSKMAPKPLAKKMPTQTPKATTKKAPSKNVGAARSAKSEGSVALFIDIDNTNASPTNLLEIISHFQTKENIIFSKIYGYSDDKVDRFEELITEHRFETAGKMRLKQGGTSVVDTRLVVDAIRFSTENEFTSVFIWAGKGDLIPLYSYLKELGKKTMTVDLEQYDTQSRFVDARIKLFSEYDSRNPSLSSNIIRSTPVQPEELFQKTLDEPYQEQKEEEEVEVISKDLPKAAILPDIIDISKAPSLPRKSGAPEFGKVESITTEVEQEVTDEYLFNMAQAMQKRYEEELRQETVVQEFGELNISADEMSIAPEPEPVIEPEQIVEQAPVDFELPKIEPVKYEDDFSFGDLNVAQAPVIAPEPVKETISEVVPAAEPVQEKVEKPTKKFTYVPVGDTKPETKKETVEPVKAEKKKENKKSEGGISYSFKKKPLKEKMKHEEKSPDAYDGGISHKYNAAEDDTNQSDEDPYGDFEASLNDFTI